MSIESKNEKKKKLKIKKKSLSPIIKITFSPTKKKIPEGFSWKSIYLLIICTSNVSMNFVKLAKADFDKQIILINKLATYYAFFLSYGQK